MNDDPQIDGVFRSKVDAWLVLVLFVAFAAWAAAGLGAVRADPILGSLVCASLVLFIVFMWWVSVPTQYVLTANELVVRSGRFRVTVPYQRIRAVRRTRNPLASAAWSLDRLRIDYQPGRVALISPIEQTKFLAVLADRSGLRWSGQVLLREDEVREAR